jgi:acyl-CoA reductase-like NAD-dependent aldehyde dehydrogenase
VADLIEAHANDLALIEALDAGVLVEAMKTRTVARAANNFRFFAELAADRKPRVWESNGARHRVRHDPSGVAGLIVPWNAPLMLSTWKIGPALAAGCTVVVKPAEWAPLTNSVLADIYAEAGLPAGVVNVVQGIGEEAGAALAAHPGLARISFTGSRETAESVGIAAAKNITPVSFELGGKSAFLVFEDADLDAALETAARQYEHAGQICLAGTRLLVAETIADEFQERLLQTIDELVIGDPRSSETDVGPLIHRDHLARVDGYVRRAVDAEAVVLAGGHPLPEHGPLYYAPTLLTNVQQDAEIVQREVFGPVLTLQTFTSEQQAVELANGTDYGLAATLFTQDDERIQRLGEQLAAGTIWVNCYFLRDLSAPFGGCRRSGIGREGGEWSFDFYADVKTLTVRSPA